jgi:hypothetical protein
VIPLANITNYTLGRVAFMSYITKEYVENVTEEEGDYLEDATATALYIFTMTSIIVGEGFFYKALGWGLRSSGWLLATPPALAVWVPVVIGGGIAYLIDEEEGLANYVDFLEDVVTLDVDELADKLTFTVETLGDELLEVVEETGEFIVEQVEGLVEGVEYLGGMVLQEVEDMLDEILPDETFDFLPDLPYI